MSDTNDIRQAEKDRLFSRLRSEPGLAYPEARRDLAALEGPLPVRKVHGRRASGQAKTRRRVKRSDSKQRTHG